MKLPSNRLSYVLMWVWIIVPISFYSVWALHGSPYVLYGYNYTAGPGFHTACRYVGWKFRLFEVPPRALTCDLIRFFKPGEAQ